MRFIPPAKHEPTPDEIARECAKIRATWSESERLKRLVAPPSPAWHPPLYDDLTAEPLAPPPPGERRPRSKAPAKTQCARG